MILLSIGKNSTKVHLMSAEEEKIACVQQVENQEKIFRDSRKNSFEA